VKANVTLDTQLRGYNESEKIRKEFEERGEQFEKDLRAEFERRGEIERKRIEDKYRALGEEEQEKGAKSCDCMLMNACENVKAGSSAEKDICNGVRDRLEGVDCSAPRRRRQIRKNRLRILNFRT